MWETNAHRMNHLLQTSVMKNIKVQILHSLCKGKRKHWFLQSWFWPIPLSCKEVKVSVCLTGIITLSSLQSDLRGFAGCFKNHVCRAVHLKLNNTGHLARFGGWKNISLSRILLNWGFFRYKQVCI